ncbi:MAG: sugar-binding domain-containing protein [Nanoarchaeota archaeon]
MKRIAVVDNQKVWQALMKNDETQKLLEKAKKVDIALVGIGAPIGSSNLVETGYFEKKQIKEMQEQGVAGDICSRFFDEQGQISDIEINKRTIGIKLDDLKNINEVIGVAGGEEKVSSILGALKGDFIDVLITDSNTAKLVLDKK